MLVAAATSTASPLGLGLGFCSRFGCTPFAPTLPPWHIVGPLALLAPRGLESALSASQLAPRWQDWRCWGICMVTISIRLITPIWRRKWQGISSQRGCNSSSSTQSGIVGSSLHPLRWLQASCRNHTYWSRGKLFPPWKKMVAAQSKLKILAKLKTIYQPKLHPYP